MASEETHCIKIEKQKVVEALSGLTTKIQVL